MFKFALRRTLLRTSALQALPEPLRIRTVWHADRVTQRASSGAWERAEPTGRSASPMESKNSFV